MGRQDYFFWWTLLLKNLNTVKEGMFLFAFCSDWLLICDYDVLTNNYVESWHRTLKEVYLQKLGSQQVDILVYVLMDMVLLDFMADCVKTGALFQSGALTIAEKRRRLANGINDDDAAGMINNDVPRATDCGIAADKRPRQ